MKALDKKPRIMVVVGTRPEAIKLARVINLLRGNPEFDLRVCSTGQHREMLQPMLRWFGIVPDHELDLMTPNQSLATLTSSAIVALDRLIEEMKVDLVVVQGDTTSVMAAALAAFYRGVPVAHVEAGLRTYNSLDPFPEELNRRVVDALATFCFAPTPGAAAALINEGVPKTRVFVTGNTAIDSLFWTIDRPLAGPLPIDASKGPIVLVTIHRRESFGLPIREILHGLVDVAKVRPDLQFVFPVHMNPNVRQAVREVLEGQAQFTLLGPLPYEQFAHIMRLAALVVTDSGGVQEEAPTLGKRVVVVRETTERPEAIDAGVSFLAGTNRATIARKITTLLASQPDVSVEARRLFGDGNAAARIVQALTEYFTKQCEASPYA